jgi:hypothetical protein
VAPGAKPGGAARLGPLACTDDRPRHPRDRPPFFTFRYLLSVEDEADIPSATAQAELSTEEWLTSRGYGFKGLNSTTVDMSQAPIGARQRRAAR